MSLRLQLFGLIAISLLVSTRSASAQPSGDERACERGDGAACNRAALVYRRGKKVARDDARATRLFERGCSLGHAGACSDVGYALQHGLGIAADLARGASYYEKSCSLGSALGCFNLGHVHDRGKGVEADLPRAAELYRRSCDEGFALACTNLSIAYRLGRGLPKDAGRAFELMKGACEQGTPLACANLGEYHLLGIGTAVDYAEARELGSKSCDAGQGRGCWVAALASEGSDFTSIARWLERGCKAKFGRACADLGDVHAHAGEYRVGPGSSVATLPRDAKKARALYDEACRLGDAEGCARRDRMDRAYLTRSGWTLLLPPSWKEAKPGTQEFTSPDGRASLEIRIDETPPSFVLDEEAAPVIVQAMVDELRSMGVEPHVEKRELETRDGTGFFRYALRVPDAELIMRGVFVDLSGEILHVSCMTEDTFAEGAVLCDEALGSLRYEPR